MQNSRLVSYLALCFVCTTFTLSQLFGIDMGNPKALAAAWLPLMAVAQNSSIDLSWHPPNKTWINDLDQVLNSTGTHGFHFNGSKLPFNSSYGTYNWCNMP
jgi:hypothetical protein